jgi:hypothetical protein
MDGFGFPARPIKPASNRRADNGRFVMHRTILIGMVLALTAAAAPAADLRWVRPQGAELAAKAALEACGYQNVRNLTRDPVGNWAAEAERGGVEIPVVLQINGEIAEE